MRLFVALPVSESLRQAAADWRARYETWPVRWIPDAQLHITVIPPWDDVDEQPIIELLREAEGAVGPFALAFHRACLGPHPRAPRLVWVEGENAPALIKLKQHLERALDMEPDPRPFRLHLTLARFSAEQYAELPNRLLNEPVSWQEHAKDFALMRSDLFPGGAEYTTLSTHHC